MLEKMDEFFNNRVDLYEEHQLNAIDCAKEFYPFTAECLPLKPDAFVLDLGCGTGLELDYYFRLNPTARITGIDVAEDMLDVLKKRFSDKAITVIKGSYFDVSFGNSRYDAAVSVESLHHFTKEEKVPLYKKVRQALSPGGFFILTDYFAESEETELRLREELRRIKTKEGIRDGGLYHFDTPLTAEHEIQALEEAGFSCVSVLKRWGATCTVKAVK